MPQLPSTDDAPFVRTDFSNPAAWRELVAAVRTPSEDGFLANITVIDDAGFEGAGPRELAARVREHAVLFVADAMTLSHADKPILCIEAAAPHKNFRVVPKQLWGVENNLSLANMDWDEFAEAADADGIFRGFA
jgi:hypothetical protein